MKPLTPHDPLDDLIAAALHGDLTPEERTHFEARLAHDPAARAAYQDAQLMHDLLEKTHASAQPDPAFEQRMVSGVRRRLQDQTSEHETAWESVLVLWRGVKMASRLLRAPRLMEVVVILFIIAILAGVALGPITNGIKKAQQTAAMQEARAMADAASESDANVRRAYNPADQPDGLSRNGYGPRFGSPNLDYRNDAERGGIWRDKNSIRVKDVADAVSAAHAAPVSTERLAQISHTEAGWSRDTDNSPKALPMDVVASTPPPATPPAVTESDTDDSAAPVAQPTFATRNILQTFTVHDGPVSVQAQLLKDGQPSQQDSTPAPDTRKLIRNAQLDLEVKSYQAAMDEITALTKEAGGYVDTSNSQKGGNGKLQGTVVVKVLPQNLDGFLFKLRDLGELANQSVSTEDVTKDYYDTQARLVNSQKMEVQLQDLLKRTNGKVSDLLQVERELGRVRGEIEQMQGSLRLYDFQVEYATVTINMREKDLNQAAAYLLKEQDDFSLFATDVEVTFQKARQTADTFKAQILQADLNHNSGSDVSAELMVLVAPDQIEPFLDQIRALGRVANFTRQTQRVAKDGGDSDQPADQTLTEKDKVQVHLSIRSDDETRKQVALTVVTPAVDTAYDQAKTAALANAGITVLNSSLNKTPEGQSTAQLTLRVPGKDYSALMDTLRGLGRTASLSIQRNDDSGPGANGDDAPVIVSLSLTDDDVPLQETNLVVMTSDVNDKAQQLKKTAADLGVAVKASSFQLESDGTELAQMTFRLPLSKYPAFIETLKNLGKVETLTVNRQDHPDEARTDDDAPAEISLQLHNQGEIVPDNDGLWATLRQTFGQGAGALFASVRIIGVIVAFLLPWVFVLGLAAWVGRRVYLWRKGRK